MRSFSWESVFCDQTEDIGGAVTLKINVASYVVYKISVLLVPCLLRSVDCFVVSHHVCQIRRNTVRDIDTPSACQRPGSGASLLDG